ncbi:MAG: hypothetical protein ACRDS9_00860 [Pseudonocardiaceae bacterium]
MTATYVEVASGLRAWAKGLLPVEAAVEILIRAHGGRLLRGPWVKPRDQFGGDGWWLDVEEVAAAGYLSGGERRLLAVVASLADYRETVSLSDVLPGLDQPTTRVVLAAMAHAARYPARWPDEVAR